MLNTEGCCMKKKNLTKTIPAAFGSPLYLISDVSLCKCTFNWTKCSYYR